MQKLPVLFHINNSYNQYLLARKKCDMLISYSILILLISRTIYLLHKYLPMSNKCYQVVIDI